MFVIHMPLSAFNIGDTSNVLINGKPTRITWRDRETLVIGDDDVREIALCYVLPNDQRAFYCADKNKNIPEMEETP